jgi:hypothetical protein
VSTSWPSRQRDSVFLYQLAMAVNDAIVVQVPASDAVAVTIGCWNMAGDDATLPIAETLVILLAFFPPAGLLRLLAGHLNEIGKLPLRNDLLG